MYSIYIVVVYLCAYFITISAPLSGTNVCYRYERQVTSMRVTETEARTLVHTFPIAYCCEGYTEEANKCVPICSKCSMGICIAPGICQLCDHGFWGDGCSRRCECQNNSPCSQSKGTCVCAEGFTGEKCEKICQKGTYGRDCSKNCTCLNGDCSPVDGTCSCNDGWEGTDCDKCPKGFFGDVCQHRCDCIEQNTESCDPLTGRCSCKTGWNNTDCSTPCPFPTYGISCSEMCECIDEHHLGCLLKDLVTGNCMCKSGWKGDACEIRCPLGNCKCPKGWQGLRCDTQCDAGYYGENCEEVCITNGLNQQCNPVTGEKSCAPGYIGPLCANKCPDYTFGKDCKTPCKCENNAPCNHITGECCSAGWMGVNCSIKCPPGFYGLGCKTRCKCSICRATDGFCRCQEGWAGKKCSDYCPEYLFDVQRNICLDPSDTAVNLGNQGSIAYSIYIILVSIVVLGLVAIQTVIYCRRRR